MTQHVAAVVGAGAQGRVHARGYLAHAAVDVAAIADVAVATAEETARELGIPRWYQQYEALIASERPEIVSVCTPPEFHLPVVRHAIANGVRAVHCEKPMSTTYGAATEMHAIAQAAGVQLTVNLQRRFEPVHEFARQKLLEGLVGEIVSIEGYCPNLPDWGAHICDLMLFYLDDQSPSWVMGQVDVATRHYVYGLPAETTSLTFMQWPTGVNGLIVTGREPFLEQGSLLVRNGLVVHGTEGRLVVSGARCEVHRFSGTTATLSSPFDRDPSTWERGIDPAIFAATQLAIEDLVTSLESRQEPRLASRHALAGAEMIHATYESARSRCRVRLPLETTDNALVDGLQRGFWRPIGELRSTY